MYPFTWTLVVFITLEIMSTSCSGLPPRILASIPTVEPVSISSCGIAFTMVYGDGVLILIGDIQAVWSREFDKRNGQGRCQTL